MVRQRWGVNGWEPRLGKTCQGIVTINVFKPFGLAWQLSNYKNPRKLLINFPEKTIMGIVRNVILRIFSLKLRLIPAKSNERDLSPSTHNKKMIDT